MYDQAIVKTTWTDKDWDKMTKWLAGVLQSNVVIVTFTKKDGTERIMKCTLNPEQLPPAPLIEGKKERKVNEDVMAVYDVEAQGWRSFTIKSVNRVELTIG